ncbi:MAG TPA: NmrA family NAD(P)-binding protein, partial [Candidatus Eisenbacteria bacterium]|nr:NmrA family NAD(P)-binding protein [Candidatus Eisenbacteria bacterium]
VMHVVMGASGNTGHIVANNLLTRGEKVRVIGRNSAHLQPLTSKGAEPFIADVTDASSLAKAFHGADSAYVMIPPNITSKDPLGYSNRVSDAIAAAVQKGGIRNVVALSSIGAELSSGVGPVVGLHNLEQKLNQITNANVLYLRAAYFMENTLPQANAIRQMGSAVGPLRPDLKIPMIATHDIGNAAADVLLHPTIHGKQTRELHGQRDLTYTEVASILGKIVGNPDLKYAQVSDDQFRAALVQMGMSEPVAKLLVEMTQALNAGKMHPLEPRSPQNSTPTSYETFANQVFLQAYQQQAAA